jgi:hypothetical protein
MNQVKVKILKTTITAEYGTLVEGAQLRTSSDFAAHLVDDCGAAEYVTDAAPTADDSGEENKGAGNSTAPEVPKRAARQQKAADK